MLDATERLLADASLHDLRVAAILDEAKITRPTFYYHFDSKYDVVRGLLARIIDEIAEEVRPFVDIDPERSDENVVDLYERALRESLLGAARVWRQHRPVLQSASELWSAVPELKSLWAELTGRFIEVVAATIDALRADGVAPPGPPSDAIASTLAWATERALFVSSLGLDNRIPDERSVIEPLVGQWLGGVFGAATVRRGVHRPTT